TLAQALAALKSVKPKVKGDVIKEPSVPVRTASASTKISAATTTTATIFKEPRKGIVITKLDEEEVMIDVLPLAVKSPCIVGWKIHKEGRKSYYQIMRPDGKSQMYMISHMLKSFSREDLEDLYKLVKAKYKSTRPVEDLDLLLWGDLKTIFEPHVEDEI
ncbi:hypothetical protein Tco_1462189, partial [Tanacetum coccineum]